MRNKISVLKDFLLTLSMVIKQIWYIHPKEYLLRLLVVCQQMSNFKANSNMDQKIINVFNSMRNLIIKNTIIERV